ncbi:hypothetical protein [uncultured Arcobacter sp.]|uniref:hypothetical protein n=1 Tax=uncultured Arcobacter sp. TaxID=165434 RepID=UPI002626AC97|nr:hypothetical protein [uncultured Arcobacter sp.]
MDTNYRHRMTPDEYIKNMIPPKFREMAGWSPEQIRAEYEKILNKESTLTRAQRDRIVQIINILDKQNDIQEREEVQETA